MVHCSVSSIPSRASSSGPSQTSRYPRITRSSLFRCRTIRMPSLPTRRNTLQREVQTEAKASPRRAVAAALTSAQRWAASRRTPAAARGDALPPCASEPAAAPRRRGPLVWPASAAATLSPGWAASPAGTAVLPGSVRDSKSGQSCWFFPPKPPPGPPQQLQFSWQTQLLLLPVTSPLQQGCYLPPALLFPQNLPSYFVSWPQASASSSLTGLSAREQALPPRALGWLSLVGPIRNTARQVTMKFCRPTWMRGASRE